MMDNETVNIDGVLNAAQKKLGKDYEFIRHLGGGEFSNVYLVKQQDSGQELALKILDYHYLLQRLKKEDWQNAQTKFNEIKKRFITEARLYKKIHHSNIVKIHDTGVITEEKKGIEIPYIIMSYIKGSSLSDLLRKEAPFEINRALEITRNVLNALETMHLNNIIHRDIKPGNIMIKQDTGEAIIIDFGIAKDIMGGTRLTTTGALLGSPMYMAPEQSMDSSNVGAYTDIYSYGAVLFEMLTGETPFQGCNFMEIMTAHREKPIPSAKEINPRIPVQIANIVSKAMAKNPNDRFSCTADFLHALETVIADPTIPFGPLVPSSTSSRNKKPYIYAAILILAGVTALLLLSPWNRSNKTEPPPPASSRAHTTPVNPPVTPVNDTSENTRANEIQQMKLDFTELKQTLDSEPDNTKKIEILQLFLDKYRELTKTGDSEANSIADEVNSQLTQLQNRLSLENQYQVNITAINKYLENHDYEKAMAALNKAKSIKDTPDITSLSQRITEEKTKYQQINGKALFDEISTEPNLKKFLEFKAQFPESIYLPLLKEQLIQIDTLLPPEKYWESIRRNSKGYYEITLPKANNLHQMIYIPERKMWIDKYEVSNKQYHQFILSEKKTIPGKALDQYIHEGNEYPAVVSYDDAEIYCQHYGFRLPRSDEWEYAAGKRVYTFPWGNQLPSEQEVWRANFDSLGEDGKEEKDQFDGTAPVTSFAAFASPFGAVNMAGNVWEWVQGRILKGGSFLSSAEELAIKNSIAGRTDDTQGFRCVKDEE